jgi:kinesin family protein 11
VLLGKLLAEEKSKSALLRTELIGNLTNLIVDFTDAQDASWSQVVTQVQSANEVGVGEMNSWIEQDVEVHAESSKRAEAMGRELDMGGEVGKKQREAGVATVQDISAGMRTRLEGYGKEASVMAERQVEVVDGFCERLGTTAVEGEQGLWLD